ncbi:MAG: hypothetical protein GY725_14310 [bacterium]|nr:hypothetical protein [bacterium]
MSSPGAELVGRLRERPIRPRAIASFLDALAHGERVAAIRAVGRTDQRALYEAVEGIAELELADFVPSVCGDLEQVRHFGHNSLPLFSDFEKRFCRPANMEPKRPEALYGFNFQPRRALVAVTGPGFFVARDDESRREVLIDYTLLPVTRPEQWPEIRRNDAGLSRFVYGYMVDTMRRVSEHVTIGSAARRGKDLGSWFLLTREDRSATC